MSPESGDRPLAVVLLSGGMDSCVAAALAGQACEPALMHVSYGQRTEARELRAFHAIADHYRIARRLVARLDHLRTIGGSALTDESCDAVHARRPGSAIPEPYATPTCSRWPPPGPRSWAPGRSTSARSRRTAAAIPTAARSTTGNSTACWTWRRVRNHGSMS